jgi:predicted anti-sigma-YlaC factor YlaD
MAETVRGMDCNELVELVTAYLEGALPPLERDRFDRHLAECEGCRAYLDQVRTTIVLSARAQAEGLSPAALDALRGAFRGWRAGAG